MHRAAGLRPRRRDLPEPELVGLQDDPWSLHVAQPDEVAAAKMLEHDVFVAEGFCEPSSQGVIDGYEHLNAQSQWYAAHTEEVVVGVLRVMESGPSQVPALASFVVAGDVRSELAERRFQEVGTLAISPPYRGTDVALHLYRAAFRAAVEGGVSVWLAVVEVWLLEHLQGLGFPFRQISESRYYMGGECLAASMSFDEARLDLGSKDLKLYQWITRGLYADEEDDSDDVFA